MLPPSFISIPVDCFVDTHDGQYHIRMPFGECIYIPRLFTNHSALYAKLLATLMWRQDQIRIYGKLQKIPRKQAWYGEHPYIYSGTTLAPQPFTPELYIIKEHLEQVAHTSFNSVLANLYQDGTDYMNWHTDDEPELGPNPIIASVSFGAARDFSLRNKQNHKYKMTLTLEQGSAFIMLGSMQHYYQHCIPKRTREKQARISLTYRFIHPIC